MYVLIDFGAEVEATDNYLPWMAHARPKLAEAPLPFTRLPGLLEAWQHHPDGWVGLVAYSFPTRGGCLGTMYGSFPAAQLTPVDGPTWLSIGEHLRVVHRTAPR